MVIRYVYIILAIFLFTDTVKAQFTRTDFVYDQARRDNYRAGNEDMRYQKQRLPANYDSLFKGKQYQHFNLVTNDGKVLTNESSKGKVTFICFWLERYEQCREEVLALNEFYDNVKNDTLCQFITVTACPDTLLHVIIKGYKLRVPIANTKDHASLRRLSYDMPFPGIIVLDKNGNISAIGPKVLTTDKVSGQYSLTVPDAISMVKALE